MPHQPTTIYVIDDDASVRRSLSRLLRSAGYAAEAFASLAEFVAVEEFKEPGCVITDMRMRGGSGLDVQKVLCERGSFLPVILVTAHDTEEMRAEARRAGVAGYFRKPVDDQALIDAVEWALSKSHA